MAETQQPTPYTPPTSLAELFDLTADQRLHFVRNELDKLLNTQKFRSPAHFAVIAALTDVSYAAEERTRNAAIQKQACNDITENSEAMA